MFKKLFGSKDKPAARAASRPPIPTSFEALSELAFNHAQALIGGHIASWGMDKCTSWDVDLQAGTIAWLFDDKIARAPAQLLGTYSERDQSFLWGWDHPSAPPGTAIAAQMVKQHADAHGITQLQDSTVPCPFDDTWRLVAPAVLIGDLQGVYRGQAGPGTWAFVGFGNITLSKN